MQHKKKKKDFDLGFEEDPILPASFEAYI